MFDIGGPELILVAVIAIIVIGPKELPAAIRTVTMWVRRARGLAMEFRAGVDEMVREAEFEQMRDDLKSHVDPDGVTDSIRDDIEHSIDPDGDLKDLDSDWYSTEDELYDYGEDDADEYQSSAEESFTEEQAELAEVAEDGDYIPPSEEGEPADTDLADPDADKPRKPASGAGAA